MMTSQTSDFPNPLNDQSLRREYFRKDEVRSTPPHGDAIIQRAAGLHLSRPSALQPVAQDKYSDGIVNNALPRGFIFQ